MIKKGAPVFAGIDQGTTSTRILVVDDEGNYDIAHVCSHKQITPKLGWVEHDPEDLMSSLNACLDSIENIQSLGIDNQGETIVAWDKDTGEAVYNAIVWQDSRTHKEINELKQKGLEDEVKKLSGLPLDPYFSASKFSWIIKNVPKARELLAKKRLMIGTTETFFIYRLTGEYFADYATASRTSLMNINTMQWDERLCEIFEVPLEILAPLRDCSCIFGTVKHNGESYPLAASIVDQFACLYGHGCRKSGDLKITFGTGAFIEVLTGETPLECNNGPVPMLAWRNDGKAMFGLDGGVYNAASAMNWFKNISLIDSFKDICSFEKDYAINRDLMFVPALSGLACPYWDRTGSAMLVGMGLDTTKKDIVQAALEGIALRTNTVLNRMAENIAIKDILSVDGGMSVNPYFMQFLADITQKTVRVPACKEVSALGAAMLGRKALGFNDEISISGEDTLYTPRDIDAKAIVDKYENLIEKSIGLRQAI